MVDSEPVLEKFFYYCHLAGRQCALYRDGDKAGDIKSRFDKTLARLTEKPRIIIGPSNIPVMLTVSDIKALLFTSLYMPVKSFPILATVIHLLHEDKDLGYLAITPELTQFCLSSYRLRTYPDESGIAIGCSDRNYKVSQVP
jgi:hypothetical protein